MNKDTTWFCEYCNCANDGLKCTQCGALLQKSFDVLLEETEIESPYYATREQMFGKHSGGVSKRSARTFKAVWADE